MLGLPSWPHFPHSSRPGQIQVSALGQLLGQNGNIASMVSNTETSPGLEPANWQQSTSSCSEYHHSLPLK